MFITPSLRGFVRKPKLSIPMEGLQLWVTPESLTSYSSASAITLWTDSSGNGNNLTRSADTAPLYSPNVINGYGAARFDGTVQYLDNPVSPVGWSGGEIFGVLRIFQYPPVLTSATGLWTVGGFGAERTHYSWTDGVIYENFLTSTRKSFNPDVTMTDWHLYNVLSAPNNWVARQNNSIAYSTETSTFDGSTSTNYVGVSIGKILTFYYLYGQIAEVILYNRVLSATERTKVNAYVTAKYNITML